MVRSYVAVFAWNLCADVISASLPPVDWSTSPTRKWSASTNGDWVML